MTSSGSFALRLVLLCLLASEASAVCGNQGCYKDVEETTAALALEVQAAESHLQRLPLTEAQTSPTILQWLSNTQQVIATASTSISFTQQTKTAIDGEFSTFRLKQQEAMTLRSNAELAATRAESAISSLEFVLAVSNDTLQQAMSVVNTGRPPVLASISADTSFVRTLQSTLLTDLAATQSLLARSESLVTQMSNALVSVDAKVVCAESNAAVALSTAVLLQSSASGLQPQVQNLMSDLSRRRINATLSQTDAFMANLEQRTTDVVDALTRVPTTTLTSIQATRSSMTNTLQALTFNLANPQPNATSVSSIVSTAVSQASSVATQDAASSSLHATVANQLAQASAATASLVAKQSTLVSGAGDMQAQASQAVAAMDGVSSLQAAVAAGLSTQQPELSAAQTRLTAVQSSAAGVRAAVASVSAAVAAVTTQTQAAQVPSTAQVQTALAAATAAIVQIFDYLARSSALLGQASALENNAAAVNQAALAAGTQVNGAISTASNVLSALLVDQAVAAQVTQLQGAVQTALTTLGVFANDVDLVISSLSAQVAQYDVQLANDTGLLQSRVADLAQLQAAVQQLQVAFNAIPADCRV